jgi:hypothetical protein
MTLPKYSQPEQTTPTTFPRTDWQGLFFDSADSGKLKRIDDAGTVVSIEDISGPVGIDEGGTGADLSSGQGVLVQSTSGAVVAALGGTGVLKLTSDVPSVAALLRSEMPTGALFVDAAISGTLQAVEDKDGNASALQLSTKKAYVSTTNDDVDFGLLKTEVSSTLTGGTGTPYEAAPLAVRGTYTIPSGVTANYLFGLIGSVYRSGEAADTGTASVMRALSFGVGITNTGATVGVVEMSAIATTLYRRGTGAYGTVYGINVATSGTATTTTQYGVYLNLQTSGVTTAYSIYNAVTSRFMAKLPTSSSGLSSGELWCDTSDSNRVKMV